MEILRLVKMILITHSPSLCYGDGAELDSVLVVRVEVDVPVLMLGVMIRSRFVSDTTWFCQPFGRIVAF